MEITALDNKNGKTSNLGSKQSEQYLTMVSPEEISILRIVKHRTLRSNVTAESSKNYYFHNLCCPFLDCIILQLDQRFPGHAEAVMRLTSLLPANANTANFCKVEPADL